MPPVPEPTISQRDECRREKSDRDLEEFAEDANSNLDNWLANKADEGDDWNEWSMADALAFMEAFESMIHDRKVALVNDVRRAEAKKVTATNSESSVGRELNRPIVSIGDTVSRDGATGVVVDVQPATMYPGGEPTVDVQVDFSGTSRDPDFDPIDCPWFDQSELVAFSVERDRHEGPFQIGSVLEYGVEVVPWVPGMFEESVEVDTPPAAVQVWTKEWGDADNDCAGWGPRAIAQIARERGVAKVTSRDLQDILDDPDILKIAFRPDISIAKLLEQINDSNH